VRLAKLRWRIEHDYRELKDGVGLDHFEGRGYRGWHLHVTLAAASASCWRARELDRDQHLCPVCGSADRHIEAAGAISIETSLRLQARQGQPGEVAPHRRHYNDILWNADRQRRERRIMVIDTEQDYYLQEWYDLETNQCTWRKEGRLSDPDMHGRVGARNRLTSPDLLLRRRRTPGMIHRWRCG
jgi:hypothetical protein